MEKRPLAVRRLGRVPYAHALEIQRVLIEERRAERVPDTLLLLEHPHVLTLGVRKGGGRTNILATPERLRQLGVEVFEAGRGGDVTYHGPGQLVGYPIIDLRPDRQDVHRYVRDLEETLIRVCADFGVSGERLAGFSGVWVHSSHSRLEKVAAIGVRIARWVTSHGFALNVTTDLDFFRLIVPCGIQDRGVTSLSALTSAGVDMRAAQDAVATRFAEVFDRELTPEDGVGLSPAHS